MNTTKTTSATDPAPTVVQGTGPGSVQRAREAARAFTSSLGPAPGTARADTLLLVVSELVTNAVRHGGGRYTLELCADPHTLTVAVSDPSPARPRERPPDLNGAGGGFGWHMVRDLTHHLTIPPGPGPGKTIHAQLPR
jgi:anti-sigma regulatory factor (Ser/Thr protein kinase)